jgi:trehalose 6-phosphate phosphatase
MRRAKTTTTHTTNSSVPDRSVVRKISSETLALTFPFSSHAILLDIDGTILDLAPTPAGVLVPSALQGVLTTLWKWTGGALALVSGRPLKDIDRIFAPLELPAIGGHGSELRIDASSKRVVRPVPLLEERIRRQLMGLISKGVIAEDKGHSLALHYRAAPHRENELRSAVESILSGLPNGAYEILPGKCVIEVKPTGFNKGTAVLELMEMPPFTGRTPLFVGDDITDDAVFAILSELNGIGFSVGRIVPGVTGVFKGPDEVRTWLARIASQATDQ